jgi:hypothetical protein
MENGRNDWGLAEEEIRSVAPGPDKPCGIPRWLETSIAKVNAPKRSIRDLMIGFRVAIDKNLLSPMPFASAQVTLQRFSYLCEVEGLLPNALLFGRA